jgi:L-histidine Nalpha-methyltransferase
VARLLQRRRHRSHRKDIVAMPLRPPANDSTPTSLAADLHVILAGLLAPQKQLEPRFFYDERGSELFERITALSEYYPTRTELTLLREHAGDIGRLAGPHAAVIELGAGSSLKARMLLRALDRPAAYVPVDISADYLERQATDIAELFPSVAVLPLAADFTEPLAVELPNAAQRTLLFFPGSTIGNLARTEAGDLLARLRRITGGPSDLLVGVDICADPSALHDAYNDASGVTSEFNLNLLARMNRELGADFDLAAFEHEALYDDREARVEMRLVSRRRQTVTVCGTPIDFEPGEYGITEYSHKYTPQRFASLTAAAGWRSAACWLDDEHRFSLHYLRSREH